MLLRAIDRFFSHEASGGILLMLATVAALLAANSGFQQGYEAFLSAKLSVTVNGEGLNKPLILWINDGLMAIFFFLIGLELKREMLEGKLKNPRDIVLPGVAALGGMALPAVICYYLFSPFIKNNNKLTIIAAYAAGFLCVFLSAVIMGGALIFTEENFMEISMMVIISNLPVMIIEGFITTFCILFLKKVQPDLISI